MDAYLDKENYFDKYFQMDTILIIFFYKYIILFLNSINPVVRIPSRVRLQKSNNKGLDKEKSQEHLLHQ